MNVPHTEAQARFCALSNIVPTLNESGNLGPLVEYLDAALTAEHTPALSIIVPTLNEGENLGPLVERLEAALTAERIPYEIIVVDDHSEDATLAVAESLADAYPIRTFAKHGEPGKAYSILEGIEYASADTLCMIDADLQYPPEYIPAMLACIRNGSDIVVANRIERETSQVRKFASDLHAALFCRLLHGLDVDVQSGLKLFRKRIFQRLDIKPSAWSFDLEFLTQARDAGYQIESVDVPFLERVHGETKVKVARVAVELASAALVNKLRGARSIALNAAARTAEGYGFHYKGQKFVTHTRLEQEQSALTQVSPTQIGVMLALLLLFLSALVAEPRGALAMLLGVIVVLYVGDLLFNLFLIYRSFRSRPEITISDQAVLAAADRTWPRYTIFCPLYQEAEVLPQFVMAMQQLDYPPEQLQIMLLLEENDPETIAAAQQMELPSNIEIVVVPHSLPKTKPKACNYGLHKATGEYVVIYDAEDVPEPQQLKKAVLAFEQADPQVKCIQAKLNFYNPEQNLLTRLFTAEYSCWFDLILPGLQSINAPIPLGGTSNHFRLRELIQLEGWDAFNVTEDCDLGIRLAKRGYRTAVIDSTTYEEANSDAVNWFWQRSRWIKGYIQTYLVHMRDIPAFFQGPEKHNLLTFQLVVGGKVLALFVNPLMWCLTIAYFVGRATLGEAIESLFSPPILYLGTFSLVVGNFLYGYYYMIGCARREYYSLLKYVFLVPFYWLGMSAAAWMALYKLVRQPHQWSKTKHGLHLKQTPVLLATAASPAMPGAVRHSADGEMAREVNG